MGRAYGIGRVPADVDLAAEARAEIEAQDIEAHHLVPLDHGGRPWVRCRRCGEEGYVGEYPFSTHGYTLRGTTMICDDCGA